MFNKKNRFHRLFGAFLLSFVLISAFFSFSSLVLASDTFGANFVDEGVNLSNSDPRSMATKIINVALGLLGIVAVVIVIYGGFIWMSSEGNEERVEKAKKILKAGVIGLAIVLASWGIASFVLNKLGGATGVVGVACVDNAVRSCGCNGNSTCLNGEWGVCSGSDCNPGGPGSNCYDSSEGFPTCNSVTTCNSGLICDNCECKYPGEGDPCGNISGGTCAPLNSDCNPNLFCDATSCTCEVSGNNNYSELGDPCSDGGSCNNTSPLCNPNHGLVCDPGACKCVGNPVITGFSPLGGFCNNNINNPCSKDSDCDGGACNFTTPNTSSGNFFTILGYNFNGYSSASSSIKFIKPETNTSSSTIITALDPELVNYYCSDSWTNTIITVALPTTTAFTSGDDLQVEVITKEGRSYNSKENPSLSSVKWNIISRPGICGMSTTTAKTGGPINYYGINLNGGEAYFGNYVSNIKGYAVNSFNNPSYGVAHVPSLASGKTSTFVQKKINNVSVNSNFLDFTKLAEAPQGPSISFFDPTSGPAGQYLTIVGSGFGNTKGGSQVSFKGTASPNTSTPANFNFPLVCAHSVWSDNKIIVKVPDGISDGDYNIVVKIGNWDEISSNNIFTASSSMLLSPGLCKISPASGPQKSSVSLWGEYFGSNPEVVFYNNKTTGTTTLPKEDGADKISVTVPDNSLTGPVKVRNGSLNSNIMNFTVGSCASNSDCPSDSGFCCSAGTPSAGSCVSYINDCFSDTPASSFFQWGFTTGFNVAPTPTSTDSFSCASYNFCPTDNWTCPNMPGLCSPYNAQGKTIETGSCTFNCSNFSFCQNPNSCAYNSGLDACELNNSSCSLSKEVVYNLGYGTSTKTAICKEYKITGGGQKHYFEITTDTICPIIDGIQWSLVPGTNNKCVDVTSPGATSTCSLCPSGATCQSEGSGVDSGVCVSPEVCPGNSICYNDNKCKKADTSSCQCCCEKDKNLSDDSNPACCYPLTCDNACGVSANSGSSNSSFGLCSGCNIVSANQAQKDLACNCATVSGQYCEVSDQYEKGVCLDCTSLGESSCKAHSTTCCWDQKNSICRGGLSDTSVWGVDNSNIGYCPYYGCQFTDPTQCASTTPTTIGEYSDKDSCGLACASNCPGITNENLCKNKEKCCWNASVEGGKCLGGDKFSSTTGDTNYGLCAYYNCSTAGSSCTKVTTTTQYLNESACNSDCTNTSSGFGNSCYVYPNLENICSFGLCNMLSCLNSNGSTGDNSNTPDSCGVCCCNPSNDQCSSINEKLTCVANKGACTGSSRGLCCGCSSDADCSVIGVSPTEVGCGLNTCCQARPKINTDNTKVANLDVLPAHRSNNICRNSFITVKFDQRMDPLTLDGNILLLEEKDSSPCSPGTYQIVLADKTYQEIEINKNIFAKIRNIFSKTVNSFAKIISKNAIASPNSSKTYCAVLGLVSFDHDTSESNKTTAYFKPNNLLKPATKYFVVVKGDKNLDSSSGVKAFSGVGMNGTGYFKTDNNWEESNASTSIKFNTVYYENSYIWSFTTLSVNVNNSGICTISSVKISPESYLFQTNKNDLNENDVDPGHSTFNSVRDRDAQYTARAYSIDGQLLATSTDYNWDWTWQIENGSRFEFGTVSSWATTSPRQLLKVKENVVDGQSKISATVKITTTSKIHDGNGVSSFGNAYILNCRNPWPAFNSSGLWYPWGDATAYGQFNYEFYYCRDRGSEDYNDDLPELLDDLAVIKGSSMIRVCSNAPSQTCNINSDCASGGVCLASFLKETYFFRNIVDRFVKNVVAADKMIGGVIGVSWESKKDAVSFYKVYYKLSSALNWSSYKPINPVACEDIEDKYICETDIGGLENEKPYDVYVVAVSGSHNETNPSLISSAIPSAPDMINFFDNFLVTDKGMGGVVEVSWDSNENVSDSYKVYYKLSSASDSNWLSKDYNNPLNICDNSSGQYFCSITLDNLVNDQSYDIYIAAIFSSGYQTLYSATSSIIPSNPLFKECGDYLYYNDYNYKTIKIGQQCWMGENLKTIKYSNGANIIANLDNSVWRTTNKGAYAVYPYESVRGTGSDDEVILSYGILYNWFAVESGNLCPIGWRVSSSADFNTLATYLKSNSLYWCNNNSLNIAKSLASEVGWLGSTATCAVGNQLSLNNATEFNAMPAGLRNPSGGFSAINTHNYLWTSTSQNETSALTGRIFNTNSSFSFNILASKNYGFSVRCLME